jgi:hypothetical protein
VVAAPDHPGEELELHAGALELPGRPHGRQPALGLEARAQLVAGVPQRRRRSSSAAARRSGSASRGSRAAAAAAATTTSTCAGEVSG